MPGGYGNYQWVVPDSLGSDAIADICSVCEAN